MASYDSYKESRNGFGTLSVTLTGAGIDDLFRVPLCSQWVRLRPRSGNCIGAIWGHGELIAATPENPLWLYVGDAAQVVVQGTPVLDIAWFGTTPSVMADEPAMEMGDRGPYPGRVTKAGPSVGRPGPGVGPGSMPGVVPYARPSKGKK